MSSFYLLIAFAAGGIFYSFRPKSVISLTITDAAVFAFLFYGLLHVAIVQGFRCDPLACFKWSGILGCYLFFRRFKKPRVAQYGIVSYGLFQSLVAVGQSLSLFESSHRFFSVTGTIGNPGPLGGFIAVSTVCCIGLLRAASSQGRFSCRLNRILLGSAACVLMAGLLLTDSRAAFLSVPAGLIVVWGDWFAERFRKHKPLTIIVFTGTAVALCCLLYFHRSASADARVLIWRVSAEMIAEKPLFGRGVGAFDREYMLYQADYFEHHPESPLATTADNAAYPYNELIHVLIESGIVGGILLSAVFFAGLAFRSSDRINQSLKAGLTAFIVFSLFSYPAEVIELLILPAIFLGSLQGQLVYILPVRPYMKYVAAGLLSGIIVLSVTSLSVLHKISGEIARSTASGGHIPTPCCDRYFPILKYNADFNMTYLPALCRLPCQTENRCKIENLFPSSETFCCLGEAYECYGEDKRAEQFYRKAADMVPARILPNYRLWQLYVKYGDEKQAGVMARKILSQPVKVENTFTLQVKGKMKRYLVTSLKIQ
ncbi:MAG: O-antigen ligase family protein [Candidatus Azobacteroides sp.]|nr:O-antigen ligase family protein [Candidatus Azobacteroides sp.]